MTPGSPCVDQFGNGESSMLDADDFLGFTERLRAVHERVDAARVSREQRGRWQRRLLSITDAAQRDLVGAGELLRRFEADLDRRL